MRLALALLLALAAPAAAAPARYVLDAHRSTVGFAWMFGSDEVQGRMAVARAELVLDFADVARSQVDVAVDAGAAEAGFPFATQAMKGPRMLDTASFPQITFRSTRIRREGDGARIEGDLTVRGVTRPAVLMAQIYRQKGTVEGDLDHLSLVLTGALRRSEFGANGWADMVGDEVRLTILARIDRAE